MSVPRLEWSVRALAQPAHVQRSLFPSFVCVADELALEFEEGFRLVEGAVPEALARLDALIVAMSGDPQFWFDDALEVAPEWVVVRAAALDVVRAFEWSSDPPAPSPHIYIGR